ncbi:hypothetical protein JCM10207_000493 [Rhodosporidiobolus poonsookiae]
MRFIFSLFPWLAIASTLAQAAPIDETTSSRAARIPFKDRVSASAASASSASDASASEAAGFTTVWYRADPTTRPTPSSSSSTSTVHWYKADPTTSAATPSPTSTFTPDGYYTGPIHAARPYVASYPPIYLDGFPVTPQNWYPYTPCPETPEEATSSSIYWARMSQQGVWVSEALLTRHGGDLTQFCGKTVNIRAIGSPWHATNGTGGKPLTVVGSMGAPYAPDGIAFFDGTMPTWGTMRSDYLVDGKAEFKFF